MNPKKIDTGAVAGGLALVTVGMLILADRYTSYDFGDIVRLYWPLILIIIGVPKLFQYKTLWSGLWMIAVGSWMQMVVLGTFGLTWSNSWPLLLIVFGLGTIARTLLDVVLHAEADHER